jgi:hypothetical protein
MLALSRRNGHETTDEDCSDCLRRASQAAPAVRCCDARRLNRRNVLVRAERSVGWRSPSCVDARWRRCTACCETTPGVLSPQCRGRARAQRNPAIQARVLKHWDRGDSGDTHGGCLLLRQLISRYGRGWSQRGLQRNCSPGALARQQRPTERRSSQMRGWPKPSSTTIQGSSQREGLGALRNSPQRPLGDRAPQARPGRPAYPTLVDRAGFWFHNEVTPWPGRYGGCRCRLYRAVQNGNLFRAMSWYGPGPCSSKASAGWAKCACRRCFSTRATTSWCHRSPASRCSIASPQRPTSSWSTPEDSAHENTLDFDPEPIGLAWLSFVCQHTRVLQPA